MCTQSKSNFSLIALLVIMVIMDSVYSNINTLFHLLSFCLMYSQNLSSIATLASGFDHTLSRSMCVLVIHQANNKHWCSNDGYIFHTHGFCIDLLYIYV